MVDTEGALAALAFAGRVLLWWTAVSVGAAALWSLAMWLSARARVRRDPPAESAESAESPRP